MNVKFISAIPCFFIAMNSYGATWENVVSKVIKVGTAWEANMACIYLESGEVAKVDISTDTGKTEISIALAAKMAGKDLRIPFDSDGALSGGCDTGVTVRPHGVVQVLP